MKHISSQGRSWSDCISKKELSWRTDPHPPQVYLCLAVPVRGVLVCLCENVVRVCQCVSNMERHTERGTQREISINI